MISDKNTMTTLNCTTRLHHPRSTIYLEGTCICFIYNLYNLYNLLYVCTLLNYYYLIFDVKSNNFQQYNSHTHFNNTSPYYLDFHIQTHLFSIPSFDMDYSPTMSHHLSILHSFHLHFHFFSNETHLSF